MRKLAGALVSVAMWMATVGSMAQDQSGAEAKPDTATVTAAAKAEQTPAAEGAIAGDTHVRIVRLSSITGKVGMDRGIGRGVEQTMLNMPVVEGVRLGTAEGYAEVEFEDGSTLRLAPSTVTKFPLLVLHSTGVKASMVEVEQGTVFVNLEKSKDTEFTLAAGKTRIHVNPGTHLRLEMTDTKATLAVFGGSATVEDGQAPVTVAKKQTLTIDTTGNAAGEIAKGVHEGLFDEWDKQSQDYHERYAKPNALLASSPLYGISDLNYYGGFFNAAGCGLMWQPYFVTASWSPYSAGAWALYQGGYTWVSAYPWGWLPYHTGAWNYCPGRGWGWQPGGGWNGLVNAPPTGIAGVRNTIEPAGTHRPVLGVKPNPPHQPVGARTSFVVENGSGPVPRSELKDNRFVFQKDSAGLGVPRGSLGNLHGISGDVERHGFANREVYAAPVVSSHTAADGRQVTVPMSLHRGAAPDTGGDGRLAWKSAERGANEQRNAQGATQTGQTSPARGGNTTQSGGPSHTAGGGAGGSGSFHGGGGASGSGAGGGGGSFHGGGGGGAPTSGGASGGGGRSGTAPSPH